MKVTKQTLKRVGLVAASMGVLAFSDAAMARTAGDAATSIFAMFGSFADLITGGMFLVGIGLGGLSLLKFKEHSDNPQQAKLMKPIIYLICAAGLIGLPAYLAMGSSTINGDGAQQNGLTTGVYSRIGS